MANILYFPRTGEKLRLPKTLGYNSWNVQTADPSITRRQAQQFIEFWHPDACLVNNDHLPTQLFHGIPTIFSHRDPQSVPPKSILITYDEETIARLAASELLRLDLASYGFVSDMKDEYWCRQRADCFKRALKINFKPAQNFVPPKSCRTSVAFQSALVHWISARPKPIGLFAANDQVAYLIIGACARAGLSVPNDVAVLGVDNLEYICETPSVSISSIDLNVMHYLQQCAAALKRIIRHRPSKSETIFVQPLKVVRRVSTFRFEKNDVKVMAAVDLIHRQACAGLTARDVVKTFSCCRCLAERRFRAAVGHSILEEITAVRLNRAKQLLAEGRHKTDVIAAQCGYSSWSSVYRLLKKDTASAMV